MATVLPLGSIELACRFLTWAHVLEYHQAIQTVWRSGADDWRLATITGDENREPDPVLLWWPVARKPFTSQRFKGPLAKVPKPPDVVRVMCYGDSLTDGPPKGGWPTWLGVLWDRHPPLPGRRVEVLNAGVAGYSSHQGLLRFLQEVRPVPARPAPGFLRLERRGRSRRPTGSVISHPTLAAGGLPAGSHTIPCLSGFDELHPTMAAGCAEERGAIAHPRVSLDGYLANLDRFRTEAQARGIPIVFLTRPHKLPAAELRSHPTWRHSVPDYNSALVAWSQSRGVPLIDAQPPFRKPLLRSLLRRMPFHAEGLSAHGRTGPRPGLRWLGRLTRRQDDRRQPQALDLLGRDRQPPEGPHVEDRETIDRLLAHVQEPASVLGDSFETRVFVTRD